MKAILNDAVMLRFIMEDAYEWYSCFYKGEFDKELSKKTAVKEVKIFAEKWIDKNLNLNNKVERIYRMCGGGDVDKLNKNQYKKIASAIKKAYISEIISLWKFLRDGKVVRSKKQLRVLMPV
jgi:hypothetical protein